MAEEPAYMAPVPTGEERWDRASIGGSTIAIIVILEVLATVCFSLRIYTRLHLTSGKLLIDDYFCSFSMFVCWGFVVVCICMVEFGGVGSSMWQVTSAQYVKMLKIVMASGIAYNLAAVSAKTSILFLYRNLTPNKPFRLVCNVLIALCAIFACSYFFISIFACNPVHASWDLVPPPDAVCINKGKFYLAATCANIGLDSLVLVLPLHIVIPIQMRKRQKASLLVIFLAGGVVIVAAGYNTYLTIHLPHSPNYSYDTARELRWLHVETSLCVICASLTSLRPFLARHVGGSWFGSIGGSKNKASAHMTPEGQQQPSLLTIGRWRQNENNNRPGDMAYELGSTNRNNYERRSDDDDDVSSAEIKLWSGPPGRAVGKSKAQAGRGGGGVGGVGGVGGESESTGDYHHRGPMTGRIAVVKETQVSRS